MGDGSSRPLIFLGASNAFFEIPPASLRVLADAQGAPIVEDQEPPIQQAS